MKLYPQRRAALPMLGWLAAAAAPVCAQQAAQTAPSTLQQPATAQASQATAAAAAVVQAEQTPSNRPSTLVETKLTLDQTFTTNVGLRRGGEGESISRISPGIYVSSRSGRMQGFLDYRLSGVAYARNSGSNEVLNDLRGQGIAELVERRAYLDAQASITQQAVNPLGVDSVDPQLDRSNRTEVRTLQLTPRVQGRLGDIAQWEARVSHRATHSVSSLTSDSSSTQWQLQAGNVLQQLTRVGWGTQLSHNVQDFSNGRRTVDDIARGVLDWRFNPEFSAGAIAGYESSNITSDDKQGRATYGLRLNWVPSDRTRLLAETEKRFFGNSHNFTFSHRMARSAVSYSDTRALSYGMGQPLVVGRGTVYDFFDQLYASSEPDATKREAHVLSVLNANNLQASDSTSTLPAFLSSAVTLQRRQQFSYVWAGVRDALTLSVEQSTGRLVDNRDVFGDVFTTNRNLRQRGFSALLSHRLTPLSTVTLGLTQRRNIGEVEATRLLSTSVQWSTALGPRTKFSVLGRHSNYKSSAQSYNESALVGSFGMTF